MSNEATLGVKVAGNASGFQQMLRGVVTHAKKASGEISSEVGKSWGGIGKGFIGGIAGALTFEAVKGSLEAFLDKAKGIRDLSEQLNMSADATQRWQKAADALGLSFGGMQTVLTAIDQKRMDALEDPKAAEAFNRLGIDRQTVLDTKNVDNSEFARQVLHAGSQSDEARAALSEIVGNRSLKYVPAAEEFVKKKANIGDESMAVAQMAEQAQNTAMGWVGKFWNGLIVSTAELVKEAEDLVDKTSYKVIGAVSGLPVADEILHANNALPMKRTTPKTGGETPPEDLAAARKADDDRDRAERVRDSRDRVEAAKRQNMTGEAKRFSQEKELTEAKTRLEELRARKPPSYLKEGTAELDEWITKKAEKISAEEVKIEGIKADLREKPTSIAQNSLGKSGLFTATGLAVGDTHSALLRDQLSELRQINRKLDDDPRGRP